MTGLATKSYRQKMIDRFHTFDVDYSGTVTIEDFDAMAQRILAEFDLSPDSPKGGELVAGSRHFFEALAEMADTNTDGAITEEEWVVAAETKMLNNPEGFAGAVKPFSAAVIGIADVSGDGKVDHDEWARMLRAMGANPAAATQWADKLDKNGDGAISTDEIMQSAVAFYTTDKSEDPFEK